MRRAQEILGPDRDRLEDHVDLLCLEVDIRLARHLLKLAQDKSSLEATHQQLATELGSAREVISRQLKDFESRGWIKLHRGNIEFLEKQALENIAA